MQRLGVRYTPVLNTQLGHVARYNTFKSKFDLVTVRIFCQYASKHHELEKGVSIYITIRLWPDILSDIFTESRSGQYFIIIEIWHNVMLCTNGPPRDK